MTTDKMILRLVEAEDMKGVEIIMVAASGLRSVALEATGRVWTWGFGRSGQLGHNNEEDRLVLTIICST